MENSPKGTERQNASMWSSEVGEKEWRMKNVCIAEVLIIYERVGCAYPCHWGSKAKCKELCKGYEIWCK